MLHPRLVLRLFNHASSYPETWYSRSSCTKISARAGVPLLLHLGFDITIRPMVPGAQRPQHTHKQLLLHAPLDRALLRPKLPAVLSAPSHRVAKSSATCHAARFCPASQPTLPNILCPAPPLLLFHQAFHVIRGPSSTLYPPKHLVCSQSLLHRGHRCLTPPPAIAAQARSRISQSYTPAPSALPASQSSLSTLVPPDTRAAGNLSATLRQHHHVSCSSTQVATATDY